MSDSTSTRGRRVADRPPTRWSDWGRRFEAAGGTAERMIALGVALSVGVLLLTLGAAGLGPGWIGTLGSVFVCSGYAWALAARIDGRPAIALGVTAALGLVTLVVGGELLRGGAAVVAAVLAGLLAVLSTVPARGYWGAVREAILAVGVASLGAVAVLGFEPAMSLQRFNYLSIAVAMVSIVLIVHRLGAGLAGLGRRGLVVLASGAVLMLVTMGYVDLLQRYGTTGLTDGVLGVVAWSREHLGAFPRLIVALVGVPALVWGVHMRARRRQGWWVCLFGVAGTVPVAQMFVNPSKSYVESLLQTGYAVVLGLLVGYVVIRLDLVLTGSRGSRARRLEEASAVRPEPHRFEAL